MKRIAPVVLIVCFFGLSLYCYMGLEDFKGQIGFYYQEERMTRQQINDFWENASDEAKENIQDIALFRNEKEIIFQNETLNRQVKGELIEVVGAMQLVTGDRLEQGNLVSESDGEGCVLSREMSYQLFGSTHAVGEMVSIVRSMKDNGNEGYEGNGRNVESSGNAKNNGNEVVRYTVRGIVDTEEPVCLIQGNAKQSYPYIRIKAEGISMSSVKQMLARLQLEETKWFIESDFYVSVGRIFLCFPAWVLLFAGVKKVKAIKVGIEKPFLKEAFRILIPFAALLAGCGIIAFSVRFSDDYIPTAWSDFEFFTQLFHEKIDMMAELIKSQLYMTDVYMLGYFAGVIIFSVLTAGGLIYAIKVRKTSIENSHVM